MVVATRMLSLRIFVSSCLRGNAENILRQQSSCAGDWSVVRGKEIRDGVETVLTK
jgi:hypothetical protein